MAIRADQIVTEFKSDTRSLDAGFRHAERRAQEFSSNLNRTFSSIGGGSRDLLPGLSNISNIIQALPTIGNMAGALVSPLRNATEEGIRFNMMMQGAQVGFEGIAGGADKAERHINTLIKFSDDRRLNFEGILRGSQYMNVFGFALDEHVPKLQTWMSAVAASGKLTEDSVEGVVRGFGQMVALQRVNAEEASQLAERGIPFWELLAKAIGKTVAETRKLGEAGRLRGRPAVEAVTAMMEQDPRFRGQLERRAQGLEGQLTQLGNVRGRAGGLATQNLTSDISLALEAALRQEDLATRMAGGINTAIAPVSGLIRAGVVNTIGGGLTLGFQDALSAATAVLPADIQKFANDGILSPLASYLGIQSPSKYTYAMGLQLAAGLSLGLQDGLKRSTFSDEIEALIAEAAAKYGLDPNLLRAMMRQESGGRKRATSHKGASGLMQLMPATAARFGVTDIYDPRQNVMGGAAYMRWLLDHFKGDTRLALAGYNAGEGAVRKYGNKIPPYAETQNYVRAIMGSYKPSVGGSLPSGLDLFGLSDSLAVGGQKAGRVPPAEGLPVQVTNMDDLASWVVSQGGTMLPKIASLNERGEVTGYDSFDPMDEAVGATLPSAQGFDASLAKLTPGITNFIGLAKSGTEAHFDLLKAIGQVGPEAEKNFGQASSAAGSFAKSVIDSGEGASFLGITSKDAAYAFESSWMNAFTNLEGGFKGMTGRFLIGFAEMLNQMAQQWAASQLSNLLGVGLSALGGALFGGGLPKAGAPAAGNWGKFANVPLIAPKFDTGGSFGPGWAYVHKDELIHFNTSGHVYNADETRRMMKGGGQGVTNNNTTIIVQAPRQPSLGYTPKRAQREYGEMLGAILQRRFA